MDDCKDERTKPSRPFTKTLFEYAAGSTTHGISYIFEKGRLILERVFWIIVVIIAVVFAVTWSFMAYEKWQEDPVLTTISTTGLPVQDVPFPSITICAQGNIVNGKLDCCILYYKNY